MTSIKKLRSLGDTIRKIRVAKGLTREKFAIETGMARSYIYQIEEGTSNPTIKALIGIATVLEVSVKDLVDF